MKYGPFIDLKWGQLAFYTLFYKVNKLFKILPWFLINDSNKDFFSIFEKFKEKKFTEVVHNSKGYKIVLTFI